MTLLLQLLNNNFVRGFGIGLVLMTVTVGMFLFRIPQQDRIRFEVEQGMVAGDIAQVLKDEGAVRSAVAMRIALGLTGKSNTIHTGVYTLDTKTTGSVFGLAQAIVTHDPDQAEFYVTIPEGSRGSDILERVQASIPWGTFATTTPEFFDERLGFLFPDTYAVDIRTTPETFVANMRARYEEQVAPLRQVIASSSLTEQEVIVFASLLEREANSEETMRRVSGILHNRLEQGMRLQLDAPLAFLLGKTSAELTEKDLASASPYNTYRIEGLPPAPIANPGLAAIQAVLEPIPSTDLFYLTADDGTFYYAKTFAEHVRNKEKYLK